MEILHFESQMATVLYSLQNMANNNQISMKEKALIKDLLIQNDQQIQELLLINEYQEICAKIIQILGNYRIRRQCSEHYSEDDSTTKSVRFCIMKKLKLNILKSNFRLGDNI